MIYGNRVTNLLKTINKDEVNRYSKYWVSIQPKTDKEIYDRWLFSFMSVHTSWKNNIRGFQATRDMTWDKDPALLLQRLKESGVGLHARRSKGVWDFHQKYWNDPKWFKKREEESWVACRERLSNECLGIGPAKTAFVLEMCYPDSCEVCCLDTHILKLYGTDDHSSMVRYRRMENHWVNKCKEFEMPSPIARNICWDQLQKKDQLDYWSYVFKN